MNEKKKEFAAVDLVVVTDPGDCKEYYEAGFVGTYRADSWVDFNRPENEFVAEDGIWACNENKLKHYTPIEDLPLWKANHQYLDEEQQQALRNLLHRVQWDEEYAEKISFSGVDDNDIGTAFTWEYTEEGHVFWEAIDEQCANEEIQQPIIPDDVREEIQSLHHSAECVIVEEQSKPNGGSSALATQEGGSHYKKCGIQPVEYIQANGLDYFQGNVIKYTTRHKDKNGEEDIKKAIHYLQLILELQYGK